MARIKKEDVFDPKLFTGTTQEITKMIEVVKALKQELLEVLKVSQQALKGNKSMTNAEDIKKQANAINQVTQAEKNLTTVEKERIRLESRLAQARSKESQDSARIKLLIQEENRAKKERARETTKELGAYTNLSAKLNRLRRSYKNLAVQEKQNTAEGKRLLKNIQQLDAKLKNVDASVGQFQRSVGNYGKALKGLGGRLRNLAGAFGVGLGIAGFARLMRSTVSVITDFDSAIANLGAISQATGSELDSLKNNALELGESTRFTATEVAGLQTELAKLGFTTPEIIASTESILNLAAATGSDLASASKLAGSTMRAFGLEATEMERVTAVLGVATTKSGLNMEFLETAMSKVAPVSRAFGFSIEESTALLGTLANAGFDASTAATSTRNILLKLADANGDLAKELGRPVKNLPDLVKGLKELEERGIDLSAALELTDKRSVAAFQTFLNNTDTLIDLRDGITDVADELQDMSDKQLDTVNGQLALLNSKWQGMILGTSKSSGAVSRLKNGIKFLTNNLENILKVLKYVIIAFAGWKLGSVVALIGQSARGVVAWTRALIAQRSATVSATVSTRALNTAIKSNPIGLAISLLTTLIALIWDYASATDEAASSQDRLNEAVDYANRKGEITNKVLDKRLEKIRLKNAELIKAAEDEGKTIEEIDKIRNEGVERESKMIDKAIKILQNQIEAKQKTVDVNNDLIQMQKNALTTDQASIRSSQQLIDGANAEIDVYKKEIDALKDRQREAKLNITAKIKETEVTDKLTDAEKRRNKALSDARKRARERAEQKRLDAIKRAAKEQTDLITQINEELFKSAIKSAEDLVDEEIAIQVRKGLAVEEVNVEAMEKLIDEEFRIRMEALEFSAKAEKINAEDNADKKRLIDLKYLADLKELQKEKVKMLNAANDEVIEAQIEGAERLNKTEDESAKNQEERIERQQELAESLNATLDILQDRARQRTQERIALMDDEISAARKRQEELKRLAEQGNIDAQKSLAVEEAREKELQLKKLKAQRRQQYIDAALSGFKAYASKVEQGSKTPLRDTIKDLSGLAAFIKTLPTFYEGTENVGEALGTPQIAGKDGYIVRVDAAERIVDPQTNKKLGGISNNDLGRMAENYRNREMRPIAYSQISDRAADLMNNGWKTNEAVLQKFDKLEQSTKQITRAIKNMPSTEWNYDQMSDAVVQKVRTLDKVEQKHYRNGALFSTKK